MKDPSGKALLASFRAAVAHLPQDQPLLLGLSSGRDSVALLHLLLESGYRQLTLCHLDHALRPESPEDAAFVQTLGDSLQLPVLIARADVRALARQRHLS